MLSSVARLFYTPTLPPPTIVESSRDFHFCRILPGDKFSLSLERHLHYLCGALHLKPGQKVLNIGSGTGDVAVELVRFADVTVVGMESNPTKIQFARRRVQEAQLSHRISFVQSNALNPSSQFSESSFDAILVIEAVKDAPSFHSIYSELAPLLAKGGTLGIVDWCWTPSFDAQDPDHARLATLLEAAAYPAPRPPAGRTLAAGTAALAAAGLRVLLTEDLAARSSTHGGVAWFVPLQTALGDGRAPWAAECTGAGAGVGAGGLMGAFPLFGGLSREAAVLLVEAGKLNLFTPLAFFVAQRPA